MFVSRVEYHRKNRLVARLFRAEVARQLLPGGRHYDGVAIFISATGRAPVAVLDAETARRPADAIHDAADQLDRTL